MSLPRPATPLTFQGQAGVLLTSPGALSLKAETVPEPEPSPSEGQEETDLHPLLLRKPRGPIPPRHQDYSRSHIGPAPAPIDTEHLQSVASARTADSSVGIRSL